MKKWLLAAVAWLACLGAVQGATLLPNGQQQYVDANGVPLGSGQVCHYIPSTLSAKATWQNVAQTVANTQPCVTLDAAGRATIFGYGQYRQILKDSLGNTIWDKNTVDASSLTPVFAGVTSGGTADAQTLTYSPGPTSYIAGQIFSFVAGFTNTTSSATINVQGLGALAIVKFSSTGPVPLAAGDITLNNIVTVEYDGSRLQLLTVPASSFVAAITAGAGLSSNGVGSVDGTITGSGTLTSVEPVNAQSGGYTVQATDNAKLNSFTNATTSSIFIPQATGSFGAGWWGDFACITSASGVCNVTTSGSNIGGSSILALSPGSQSRLISDGANWQIFNRSFSKVVQEITSSSGSYATGSTQIPFDDTIPQVTEGDQYMSISFTPQNALSTLIVEVNAYFAAGSGKAIIAAIFRDGAVNALSAGSYESFANNAFGVIVLRVAVTANSTSPTVFTLRAGSNDGSTIDFNGDNASRKFGGVSSTSWKITEVAP